MTTRQATLIKKYLTPADKKQLLQEFSMSRETVRLKLSGERGINDEFLLRALNLAEKRKRISDAVISKLEKLAA
jgi:hypothetical protein